MIIWLACSTVTVALLTKRSRWGGPSNYMEHVRKRHRKICLGIWKKIHLKKRGFVRIFQTHSEKTYFLGDTFFKKFLQNCLWNLWTYLRYLEDLPNLDLYVNKKWWPYEIPIKKYEQKSEKKDFSSLPLTHYVKN